MDTAQIFVLILTAFAIGILVYLEMKSRRSRNQQADAARPVQQETNKTMLRQK